jgi:hypothetical protein
MSRRVRMALGPTQRSQSTREPSGSERRASGTCYRVGRSVRRRAFIANRHDDGNFEVDAMEQAGCRADDSVMRSGEAEYAMLGAGLVGIACRQLLGVFANLLAIVEANLERGRAVMSLRWNRQSAERDQQALCGDRVGCDDADQRAPSTSCAKSETSRAHALNYHPPLGCAA